MAGIGATVRVEGIPELTAKLTPALAAEPMRSYFRAAGEAIVYHAKNNARPHAFTGDVLDSFAVELIPGAGLPGGCVVVNQSAHSLYLEKGTRPHFPPVAAIAPWAEAHGLEPYAVARGIARHGTAPHPFLEQAVGQSAAERARLLEIAARQIEARAGR